MRKKIFGALLGATFMLVGLLSFNPTTAEANVNEDFGVVVDTKCVIKATGQVVGYANDCGPGEGACIDRFC
ncbi:hypothetical protein KCTC32516_00396 [Polaribacter huanghezhanensis]|uniref:hypothetical protein n=1 Tax=Polaribacter huanghezhanensis TaxID=1354726 RepID=UPI002647CF95|nr:hypothetical protein [Polaribacter huanghezhanensis]WKD85058.1 hypothetical protein KCTC32516_00396 [Polaribacter huanghezhanensis]